MAQGGRPIVLNHSFLKGQEGGVWGNRGPLEREQEGTGRTPLGEEAQKWEQQKEAVEQLGATWGIWFRPQENSILRIPGNSKWNYG